MPEQLFHNPYHFVPVKARKASSHDLSVTNANAGKWDHNSHATYSKAETYSGRLICRLDTVSPIVIGAEQVEGTEPKEIKPFELDNEPAIPASSLRGLLSGIAEAASNSALRVLDRDRPLSYRRAMHDKNLSAMGMIMIDSDKDGKQRYRLLPLALPTMEKSKGKYILPNSSGYLPFFREFTKPPLKVLFDDKSPESFTWEKQNFYYMKLTDTLSYNSSTGEVAGNSYLRFSSKDPNKNKLIGQTPLFDKVLTKKEYDALGDKTGYVRGVVRILKGDRNEMPKDKRHEVFLPYPDKMSLFCIPDSVIEKFERLADERTKENPQLPYEPIGTKRNLSNDPNDNGLRLKHGDIVYFTPNADGSEVAEVSFSSIWRGHADTVGDYFDPELLPFNEKRKSISPAELLFGFVQEKRKDDKKKSSLAFKGKVRVSFGRLTGWPDGDEGHYHDPVTLKILASPKPPSPALYFKKKDGIGYIPKAALSKKSHEPQGRKYYLHRYDKEGLPWKSLVTDPKLNNQKNRVTPLKERRQFFFHIDFDNLTEWELGLLCFAAQPFPTFHHKIGMGKPIGLGTVKIEPVGLFCIDRQQRYTSNGLFAGRYHQAWLSDKETAPLPARFYLRESQSFPQPDEEFSFDKFRKKISEGMDKDIEKALQLLGDPDKVAHPAHTPQIAGIVAEYFEQETFKWFVANDSGTGSSDNNTKLDRQKDWLKPLDRNSDVLPLLNRHYSVKAENLVFFLGGNDLEMETIRALLEEHASGRVHDNGLSWSAKASVYKDRITQCITSAKAPVLIELKYDLDLNFKDKKKLIIVDHHDHRADKDAPTSLHQVFRLLGLPSTAWTRWFDLVAANDRGYVKEMLKIGASLDEMMKIRRKDRQAQGITPEQEAQGVEAVKNAQLMAGGGLTVVKLSHAKTTVVSDLMEPALGGPGYENLLVISPGEVNFYGAGSAVEALSRKYPAGWYGGALPDYGFWGHGKPVSDVVGFLERLLEKK